MQGFGRSGGVRHVVVAEPNLSVEIFWIQLDGEYQFIERFLNALQTLVGSRETPMSRRKLIVNLNCVAEFNRGLLKLFGFQEGFAPTEMLGFRFLFRLAPSRLSRRF